MTLIHHQSEERSTATHVAGALALVERVLDGLPVPALLLDARGVIAFANAKVVHLLGFAEAELVGHSVAEFLSDASEGARLRELCSSPWDHGAALAEAAMKSSMVQSGGGHVELELHATPLDVGGSRFACITLAGAAGAQALERVSRREALLNEAQRLSKIGSWMWDLTNGEEWWSDELYRILQIDRDCGGRPYERFFALVHPHDRQRFLDGSARAAAGGPPEPVDIRVLLPDGRERVFHVEGKVAVDDRGQVVRMHGTLQDVTERKATQTALYLTEMRYREAQRIAKLGNWEWNLVTNASWWSEELYRILEEDPERFPATFESFVTKFHPDDRQALIDGQQSVRQGASPYSPVESRVVLADGRLKLIEQLLEMRVDEYGQPAAVVGTVRDITEQRALEQRLLESETRYATTVELAAVGIAHIDARGRFAWANQRLRDMLGYSGEELANLTVWDVSHPDDVHVTDGDRRLLHTGEIDTLRAEKRYVRKEGSTLWVRITSAVRRGVDGALLYDVSVVEDITARKIAEERVRYLATHDELTGLPNRALFGELLGHAIETARRHGRQCAVVFLDLDRFKIVNDSLGHAAGDLLLREIAQRLRTSVRTSDVIARLGGDEFVLLLEEVADSSVAVAVAKKILSSLRVPVEIGRHECRVTGSIGIATYPLDAGDASTLMKHADMAMYRAKEEGKNNFQFYSADTSPMSVEHLVLEAHLARALERQEFSIQYQPKVDILTGEIKGAEALIRWWNAELGTVSPAHFIPLAEDTGLIVPIGKWVLRAACEQNVAWQRRGLPKIVMSVNLSPRQFKDPALLDDIAAVLQETSMAPELLELEITESMIMHDVDDAARKADAIKRLGVRLAIDDFGTGYSSLSQLKRFPIDTLKVDRSFVRDVANSEEDRVIARTIISLGKALGVTVVAEGVETDEQLAFLRENACDEVQGYYFSKPCHPDVFAGLSFGDLPRRTDPE
jgi:diguanylate cyclase (GGDEF)-like protein/PAS domain S-box-containing protein